MSWPSDFVSPLTGLWDYFAGQALTGMISNGMGPRETLLNDTSSMANWAYAIADAMIAERSK